MQFCLFPSLIYHSYIHLCKLHSVYRESTIYIGNCYCRTLNRCTYWMGRANNENYHLWCSSSSLAELLLLGWVQRSERTHLSAHTHQSWGLSSRPLRSSCPGRSARRSRPAPAPEGEGVRGAGHCPRAHGPPAHCHCSFPETRPAGETWRAAETTTPESRETETRVNARLSVSQPTSHFQPIDY